MPDVTHILSRIDEGDPAAAEQLLPLVYDELRKLAAAKLMGEKPGQTLSATALVHEAYLRLVGSSGAAGGDSAVRGQKSGVKGQKSEAEQPATPGVRPPRHWQSRQHFFAAAAEAMRRILVDRARHKAAQKHGGGLARQQLLDSKLAAAAPPAEVIAVHDALDQLAAKDGLAAELVKLHYFGGFSIEEAGQLLGMSRATAYRLWTYARAWLRAELRQQPKDRKAPDYKPEAEARPRRRAPKSAKL